MSKLQARDDIESELVFHQREWRAQRIGWVLLALVLLLAVCGLFGGGPLSHSREANAAGSVEYERFIRSGLSTELVVTPDRAGAARSVDAGSGSTAAFTASGDLAQSSAGSAPSVSISTSYLESFRVEHVTPEPTAVRMSGDRLIYEFAAAAPGASISFHIHPQRFGRQSAELRINGGAPLAIRQLIYP